MLMTELTAHQNKMKVALEQARMALKRGEVPVGAAVFLGDELISVGGNTREETLMPTGHAEIAAIEAAAEKLGNWRLDGCAMYVTLEPCAMCAGAIINSRIRLVVYGASDEAAGCLGGKVNLAHLGLGSAPRVIPGVLSDECSKLLDIFFADARERKDTLK